MAYNSIKKGLQLKYFLVKTAKFLRTPVLQNTSSGYFYRIGQWNDHILKGIKLKDILRTLTST